MIDATPSHAVLREFFDNSSLTWGLMACGVAQLSKLFLELLLHRRWRPAVLIETGGMPVEPFRPGHRYGGLCGLDPGL